MAYAIGLTLAPDGAAVVERWWRELAASGLSRSMLELDHRPHLTLGLYPSLDHAAATKALDEVADWIDAPTLRFAGLGVFPATGTLWAAPVVTGDLLDLHAAVPGAVPALPHEHDRVDAWVPHCSLATRLSGSAMVEALRLVSARWQPFTTLADRLELVRVEPVEIVREWRLSRVGR